MKTIGLLAGMSWESSLEYYRILNETTKARLGGAASSSCIMYSFNFADIEELQHKGEWGRLTEIMVQAGLTLKKAGAHLIIICSNTMHIMADAVEKNTGLPLLHIADATAVAINQQNFKRVGLLGTRFTMEQPFYKERLLKKHGIEVVVPPLVDREKVHHILYKEFLKGNVGEPSMNACRRIITDLVQVGAEGIILGCTELPLFITASDSPVPLFNTTRIHAETAVARALLS